MNVQQLIDAWKESIAAILALGITEQSGSLETSLPSWRVREILAHLVHIEEVGAFGEHLSALDPTPEVSSKYTQTGVDALVHETVANLLYRLEHASSVRAQQLESSAIQPTAPAVGAPASQQWDWDTLLRNRAVDVWMHEQDIRRATGQFGGCDGLGIEVTVQALSSSLPYVVGKRARVPANHAVRFIFEGPVALDRTVAVGDDGRANDTDSEAQTTLIMSSETYTRLAGGREPLETFEVSIKGDQEIAARVLSNLAITP